MAASLSEDGIDNVGGQGDSVDCSGGSIKGDDMREDEMEVDTDCAAADVIAEAAAQKQGKGTSGVQRRQSRGEDGGLGGDTQLDSRDVGLVIATAWEAVTDTLDEEANLDAKDAPPVAKALSGWITSTFGANTRAGVRMKKHDWRIFMCTMYELTGKEFELATDWPPSLEVWTAFLTAARPQVSSHPRFLRLCGNICEVGRTWHQVHAGKSPDPRHLYHSVHQRAVSCLLREYGMKTKQVHGITIGEARNMFRFGDQNSIRDVSWIAAFNMGCIMGGRRPRTLVGVKLKDIVFRATPAKLKGVGPVLLPSITITFRDEKTIDVDGFRSAAEDLSHWQVDSMDEVMRGPSWWIYRLLVMRKAFSSLDPILDMKATNPPQIFRVAPEHMEDYLLCECADDWFMGSVPISTAMLSYANRQLLQRFGSDPRGFSSHRRGCVTRAATVNVLKNHGTGLDDSTLTMVTRWGG